MTRAPIILANCSAKIETPPVPITSTESPDWSLPSVTSAFHEVTAAHGSVAASSYVRKRRDMDDAVFREHNVFGEHPIDASA